MALNDQALSAKDASIQRMERLLQLTKKDARPLFDSRNIQQAVLIPSRESEKRKHLTPEPFEEAKEIATIKRQEYFKGGSALRPEKSENQLKSQNELPTYQMLRQVYLL